MFVISFIELYVRNCPTSKKWTPSFSVWNKVSDRIDPWEVLMDLENIKWMSFLMVFLFLKMNPLNYDISPCYLLREERKPV